MLDVYFRSTLLVAVVCQIYQLLHTITDNPLRVYYRWCNKKKASLVVEHPEVANDPTIGFRDLTDKENLMFRYSC